MTVAEFDRLQELPQGLEVATRGRRARRGAGGVLVNRDRVQHPVAGQRMPRCCSSAIRGLPASRSR